MKGGPRRIFTDTQEDQIGRLFYGVGVSRMTAREILKTIEIPDGHDPGESAIRVIAHRWRKRNPSL